MPKKEYCEECGKEIVGDYYSSGGEDGELYKFCSDKCAFKNI